MLKDREQRITTNLGVAVHGKAQAPRVLSPENSLPRAKLEPDVHLVFLDGLRGLAAFYVLLFHVIADGKDVLTPGNPPMNLLRFGHEAVVVFIVLSGFVLTLPVIRSPQLTVKGGTWGFLKRRVRRILPAYYAALFMLPVFFLAVACLKQLSGQGADWERISEMFFSFDMLFHLFLLHNLSRVWSSSFNPVLWSLATEWWIYFVFILVLLPVWRRYGIMRTVLVSLILSLVPTALLLLGWPTITGSPHLLGAFGLGMAGAALLFSERSFIWVVTWRTTLKIAALAALAFFCWLAIAVPALRLDEGTQWITDWLVAVMCVAMITLIASSSSDGHRLFGLSARTTRILESRPLTSVGQFSYSLYLTHLAVLAILGITLNLSPVKQLGVFSIAPLPIRILVVIPILLISAYGFYLLFEKPFLNKRK